MPALATSRTRLIRGAIGVAGILVAPLAIAMQRRRDAAVVFLYHRVAPGVDVSYPPLAPGQFVAHCEFIRRHYRVLKLSELVERVRDRKPLAGYCAITFDDGYRDFLEYAYPVLQRFAFPATHFLVVDCLENNRPTWTYRLNRLVAQGAAGSRPEDVMTKLKTMGSSERERWLEDKEDKGLGLSTAAMPAMLCPSDLSRFDRDLVEWGSHTVSHSFLNCIEEREASLELSSSKRRLEAMTGGPIRYLAYPNGYYTDDVARVAREVGYEAALAVGQAEVLPGSPVFSLPRFDVTGHPSQMLAVEVTGVVERLRRLRG